MYGLSAEMPSDKRNLNNLRSFAGSTEGLSISFEAHMVGSGVEKDSGTDSLIFRGLPNQFIYQPKKILFEIAGLISCGTVRRTISPAR